jgi:hypothetical protein
MSSDTTNNAAAAALTLREKREKADGILRTYKERLSALDEKRSALIAKIKNQENTLLKYDCLLREEKYNALNEILKYKGVDITEIMAAIRDNDTRFLLALADKNRDAGNENANENNAYAQGG